MYKYFLTIITLVFFSKIAFAQSFKKVIQGQDGIYFYVSENVVGNNFKNASYDFVKITEQGTGKTNEIGIAKGVNNIAELKKATSTEIIEVLKYSKKLKTEEALWDNLQQNPNLKVFGLAILNENFMQAVGALYIYKTDLSKQIGKTLNFKFSYYKNNAVVKEVNESIKIEKQFVVAKPIIISKNENDSVVSVVWYAKPNAANDIFFGKVYIQNKKGGFDLADQLLATQNKKKDSIIFAYEYLTNPNSAYSFYITPTNHAGFEGEPSDTITLISNNFEALPKAHSLQAKDTTTGIYLSFIPPAINPLITGIVIEKSRTDKIGYIVLDTISPTATSYLDTKVLPNVTYYYQLKTITIRNNDKLLATAWGSATFTNKKYITPMPPLNLYAMPNKYGVKLGWAAMPQTDIAGFKLYRANNSTGELKEVSLMIRDTTYVDSTALNTNFQYRYAIKSVNYTGVESKFSDAAFSYNGIAATFLVLPTGLVAAAEQGRVLLKWDAMTTEKNISGFKLYRKSIPKNEKPKDVSLKSMELLANGYKPIAASIIQTNQYVDEFSTNEEAFAYYITVVDDRGNESNTSTPLIVSIPNFNLQPPANFTARKTTQGAVLSWEKSKQQNISGYIIYRREANQPSQKQIQKLDSKLDTYTDKSIQKGKTYYYTIAAVSTNNTSGYAIEKGISN